MRNQKSGELYIYIYFFFLIRTIKEIWIMIGFFFLRNSAFQRYVIMALWVCLFVLLNRPYLQKIIWKYFQMKLHVSHLLQNNPKGTGRSKFVTKLAVSWKLLTGDGYYSPYFYIISYILLCDISYQKVLSILEVEKL